MHITSTRIYRTPPKLEDLPPSDPENPTVLATDAADTDDPEAWRAIVAARPGSDAYATLQSVLGHPVMKATEVATKLLAEAAPETGKLIVKGAWWTVGGLRSVLALREAVVDPDAKPGAVPIAILNATATLAEGASLAGRIGGQKGLADGAGSLGLLLSAASIEAGGGEGNALFLHARLSGDQGYRLADGMAKIVEAGLSTDPEFKNVTLNPHRLMMKPPEKRVL